jgi:predicted proteasome-type protease
MTFCAGIKVRDGLVGIADTLVISESEGKKLLQVSKWWQESLKEAIDHLPSQWIEEAFSKLEDNTIPIKNAIQD